MHAVLGTRIEDLVGHRHHPEAAFDILMHSGSAVMRDGTRFDVGIGLNCGRAAAGTIGSNDRFEYTFIGDSVNTASRLDGLSKRLGYKIISSTSIYERLPDHQRALFADLGEHRIRGRSQPLRLYGAVAQEEDGAVDDSDTDTKVVQLKPGDGSA